MHSVRGTDLADGEQGEERPLALLSPGVVKQRILHFLHALSHSRMGEKSLKRNLQSVCDRALN